MPKETIVDQFWQAIQNNPVLACLIVGAGILIGVVGFFENLMKVAVWLGLKTKEPSDDAKKAEAERAQLLALARARGADVIAKMQAVIDAVKKSSHPAPRLAEQLSQFKILLPRYEAAVEKGELIVVHETLGDIHKVIDDFNNEVGAHHAHIVKRMYDALPRKFIIRPMEGQDPEYDAVAREAQLLAQSTVDVARSIAFPDPASAPSAFGAAG